MTVDNKQTCFNFRGADTCVLGDQRTSACTCPHISKEVCGAQRHLIQKTGGAQSLVNIMLLIQLSEFITLGKTKQHGVWSSSQPLCTSINTAPIWKIMVYAFHTFFSLVPHTFFRLWLYFSSTFVQFSRWNQYTTTVSQNDKIFFNIKFILLAWTQN